MSADGWTFADLEPEQLALRQRGRADARHRRRHGLRAEPVGHGRSRTRSPTACIRSSSRSSQLECLQGLERMVGGVLVAYRRDVD